MNYDPSVERLNNFAKDWAKSRELEMKSNVGKYVKSGGYKGLALGQSIKAIVRKKDGEVESVAFTLKRYGVFFQKDVGRGRPMNHSGQKPRPWFNDPINENIEEFKDFLAENYKDRSINAGRALID